MDLGKQRNFETTYGWQVYDSIIQQIAEILQETKEEILQETDIIALSQVRGDEFILLLNPPSKRIWNDKSLELMNQRLETSIRKKMERFKRQRWHSNLSFHTGYSLITRDPTIRIERTIQRAIVHAREVSGQEIENEMIRYHIAFQRMISMNSILTYFQPIVYLDSLEVLGYEALSRVRKIPGLKERNCCLHLQKARICCWNSNGFAGKMHCVRRRINIWNGICF